MSTHDEIAQYLLDNPKAYIYYWDNGEWLIYPHKPRGIESGVDFKLKPVYEGHDYRNADGYIPTIADIMATALKIRIGSI